MKTHTQNQFISLLIYLAFWGFVLFLTYGCNKQKCDNIRLITKVVETDSIMMIQNMGVKCDDERERLLNYVESHFDSLYNRTVIKYGEAY